MTNNLIIFSKNRAQQLNLLLDSIKKNAMGFFDRILVLYLATDESYQLGYDIIIKKHYEVLFYDENTFKDDLLFLVQDSFKFTTFMVDDCVVFGDLNGKKEDILNLFDKDIFCYSLRLGLNCKYSHPANLNYSFNNIITNENYINDDHISINTRLQSGDFAYPLSTDGHIFRTNEIKDLLIKTNFNNPNTLEANLQQHINVINPIMLSGIHSEIVSIPNNIVNTTFKNRNGILYYISEKELNEHLLDGKIISLEDMDFSDINGPHKEIEYKFKNNE